MTRDQLEARYLDLLKRELPELAPDRDWPIRFDHCFMRVVLDNLFGGCWYEHLDRRKGVAYRQLSDEQLAEAVRLAEVVRDSPDDVLKAMNERSLRWRGKR